MTHNVTVETVVVKAGDREIDLSTLPGKSITALISRGLTHFLGSEQASRVKVWKDAFMEENGREATEDEIVAKQRERFEIAMNSLVAGTIGARAVAVQIDPVEKVMAQLAKTALTDTLRKNSIKVPKKDDKITFADGSAFTMEELVAKKLAKDGEALRREAEKIVKARQKTVDALPKIEGGAAKANLEALGL